MKHNTFSPRATAECLPSADQERLARILDDYLAGFENGTPITPEELFERYPDDAEILRGYLSGLKVFHRAAAAPGGVNMVGAVGSDSPDLPRRIGDFQLLREIGRGGMGVVYEARQLSLRRLEALKIQPCTATHDEKQ